MIPNILPSFNEKAFNCPYCKAHAEQHWGPVYYYPEGGGVLSSSYRIATCNQCKDSSIWKHKKMVYPQITVAPLPNEDIPDKIKDDFNEARDIVNRSPRAACGLLRLCIENLVSEVEKGTDDLNAKIAKLVTKGLDDRIKKALDAVRVIGGEALHPLQMDLKDDQDTANSLFGLVNIIAHWIYTQTKNIDAIYDKLPKGKLDAIEKRDGNSK